MRERKLDEEGERGIKVVERAKKREKKKLVINLGGGVK